mmetsp:Transcript_32964/g.67996  ORF Transcript_32964/g.67996 Transcript_32964/m.67996 type:complete len:139 (-) Transcript_32964:242-658(-)
MADESRLRGTAALLEEAKRADSRGLALLEELLVAFGKRDAPGLSENERHRVAAEDVEPLLELLQEVVSSSGRAAAALHHAARSQVEGGRMEAPQTLHPRKSRPCSKLLISWNKMHSSRQSSSPACHSGPGRTKRRQSK